MTDRDPTTAELVAQAASLSDQAEDIYGRTRLRNETLQSARDTAMRTTAEAESRDRSVRATVDVGGMLTDLALSSDALGRDPRELSELIISVAQEAAATARESVHQLYSALAAEGMTRGIPFLLPEPPPRSAAALERAPRDTPHDDNTTSVLRAEEW